MKYGTKLEGYKSLNEIAKELGVVKHRVYQYIEEGKLAPIYYIENVYVVPDEAYIHFKKAMKEELKNKKDLRYKVNIK